MTAAAVPHQIADAVLGMRELHRGLVARREVVKASLAELSSEDAALQAAIDRVAAALDALEQPADDDAPAVRRPPAAVPFKYLPTDLPIPLEAVAVIASPGVSHVAALAEFLDCHRPYAEEVLADLFATGVLCLCDPCDGHGCPRCYRVGCHLGNGTDLSNLDAEVYLALRLHGGTIPYQAAHNRVPEVAEQLGMSRAAVRRSMANLERLGYQLTTTPTTKGSAA